MKTQTAGCGRRAAGYGLNAAGLLLAATILIVTPTSAWAGPQGAVTSPGSGATVSTSFTAAGWAIDTGAGSGTGVDTIAVYLCNPSNCTGTLSWQGWGTYGAARSDVSSTYGSQFLNSGWTYNFSSLTPGNYGIFINAHSSVSNDWDSYQSTFTVSSGPPVVKGEITTPTTGATVVSPIAVTGFAIEPTAGSGTGVDSIAVWVCDPSNCAGTMSWKGWGTYGSARSDVATTFGSQFLNSGWTYTLAGLTSGSYGLVVYAHNTVTNDWDSYESTFTLVTANPQVYLEAPTTNQAVSQPFTISGWAADVAVPTGTGVDSVDVYAYPNPGSGAASVHLGTATYGGARSDVSATYGSQFLNTGYTRSQSGLTAGQYQLLVYAHDTLTDTWELRTVNTYVDLSTVSLTIDRSGTGTGGVTATGLTCTGGSGTQAVPCSANYTQGASVTLTAAADSGSTFSGWAGPCTGTSTCSVTLTTARYVSATFTKTLTTVTLTYYHTDMIGSVRAITDESGATVIRHDYGPFGEDTAAMTGDPLRFGGKELDPETGLANFGARYYRQTLGRFSSVDAATGSLGDTQSWNRYAYARNNPLRFIDPTGNNYVVTYDYGGARDYSDSYFNDVIINLMYPCDKVGGYYDGTFVTGGWTIAWYHYYDENADGREAYSRGRGAFQDQSDGGGARGSANGGLGNGGSAGLPDASSSATGATVLVSSTGDSTVVTTISVIGNVVPPPVVPTTTTQAAVPPIVVAATVAFPEIVVPVVAAAATVYVVVEYRHELLDFALGLIARAERLLQPTGNPDFNDPKTSPGPGWEWRGGDKGAWWRPETQESLRPDLNNPAHDPHYDWGVRGQGDARVYPDGRIEKK